jgi:hypothetical protein
VVDLLVFAAADDRAFPARRHAAAAIFAHREVTAAGLVRLQRACPAEK